MIVDAHNHVIPESIISYLEKDAETFGVGVDGTGDSRRLVHREGFAYPMFGEFLDPFEKVRKLDERGLDMAVISPSPTLFFYRIAGERNAEFVRLLNEQIAAFVRSAPGRLIGMGTLPMQSVEASISEIDYLVDELGIRSVMIGTHIDGVQLADPSLRPVLRHAASRGVFILTHPYYFGSKPGLEPYYLTNLIGNPLDTTVMAAHLIFSGTMDEIPDLKICLSHGGGFAPYQIGRLVHGWKVRSETKTTTTSPKELLRRFYFDTITHDAEALRYLIDFAGADQVLVGTDIPFDMADPDPIRTLADIGLDERSKQKITAGNAINLCAPVNIRRLANAS
ncbi:amidohydrolase family protein [Brucella sp. NM4]|uniref:amidohydrolase family protein n=1 Tax=Brucella sp. NM4 TaxID=3045175 RepID=UPI0024BC88E1|nr:amidohydrolase family protein [Brucella sp. NM4]WHS33902.1 amidohydrolase family protein [Brucella sp. NM4]